MQAESAARTDTGRGMRRLRSLSLGSGGALVLALVAQDVAQGTGPKVAPVFVPSETEALAIAPVSVPHENTPIEARHRSIQPPGLASTAPEALFRASPKSSTDTGEAQPHAPRSPIGNVAIRATLAAPIGPAPTAIAAITPPLPRAILSQTGTSAGAQAELRIESQPRLTMARPTANAAPATRSAQPESDAYIEQISPDRASDPRSFAAASEAMQVAPELALAKMERGRVAMLAMAPARLTLRAGDGAAGDVAVAMVSDDTIAVRLADLLDIVGPRMDADHLASLRASSAAQSFVTLDQLRAVELTISYDPVYDELRLHG